jgi:hypothetical protein
MALWAEKKVSMSGRRSCSIAGKKAVGLPLMDETIRDYIKRRVRWTVAIAVLGWILIPISAFLWHGQGNSAFTLLGFLVFFTAMVSMQWFLRCPKCDARIGQTIAFAVGVTIGFGTSKVKFCPYCGVNLDTPRHQPTNLIS